MTCQTTIHQTTIATPRMILRPLRDSDAGLIDLYASDKGLAEMTATIPHPFPPGAAKAFVAQATKPDRDEFTWAMDATDHGGAELMGVITLKQMDRGQAEIVYWVAPALWNAGFASEGVETLIAANPLHNTTIFASVFQDNPNSARVLTNAGFQYLGDAESFSVARNCKVATWTYSKTYT
jgi:RimJ/RimL family protein N-acetyltransferase